MASTVFLQLYKAWRLSFPVSVTHVNNYNGQTTSSVSPISPITNMFFGLKEALRRLDQCLPMRFIVNATTTPCATHRHTIENFDVDIR